MMDTKAKVFSLERVRSTGRTAKVDTPETSTPETPITKAALGPKFVQISMAQIHRLRPAINLPTFVYLQLQILSYKAGGKPFELPVNAFGLSRDQRWRALTELKQCGLISVKDHPGRSPLITMLWEYKK